MRKRICVKEEIRELSDVRIAAGLTAGDSNRRLCVPMGWVIRRIARVVHKV